MGQAHDSLGSHGPYNNKKQDHDLARFDCFFMLLSCEEVDSVKRWKVVSNSGLVVSGYIQYDLLKKCIHRCCKRCEITRGVLSIAILMHAYICKFDVFTYVQYTHTMNR